MQICLIMKQVICKTAQILCILFYYSEGVIVVVSVYFLLNVPGKIHSAHFTPFANIPFPGRYEDVTCCLRPFP